MQRRSTNAVHSGNENRPGDISHPAGFRRTLSNFVERCQTWSGGPVLHAIGGIVAAEVLSNEIGFHLQISERVVLDQCFCVQFRLGDGVIR